MGKPRGFPWSLMGVFVAIVALLWISFQATPEEKKSAAEQTSLEAVALSQAPDHGPESASKGAVKPVAPVTDISVPAIRKPSDPGNSITATQRENLKSSGLLVVLLALLIGAILTAGVFVAIRKGAPPGALNRLLSRPPPSTMEGTPSLLSQLDEIERFREAQVLPPSQVRAFKDALFERLREHYNIRPKVPRAKDTPPFLKALLALLNRLILQTELGSLRWEIKQEKGAASAHEHFTAKVSARKELLVLGVWDFLVDIHRGDTGFQLMLYRKSGVPIALDRNTVTIPPYIAVRLSRLYELAKDSAFGMTENLQAVAAALDKQTGISEKRRES